MSNSFRILALMAFGCMPTWAALTTVSDTLYSATGGTCNGSLTISWPTFVAPDGRLVYGGQSLVPVTNGYFLTTLEPFSGYTVVGNLLPSGCFGAPQTWIVCQTTGIVTVNDALTGTCPGAILPQSYQFFSLTTWYVSGSTHGLGCNIIAQAYDLSGNLMDWVPINVDATCDVTVSFGTPQSGTLEIIGGGVSFSLTNTNSLAISQGQHNFTSASILSATYDLSGNLVDDATNINPHTYLVTKTYGENISGRVVLIGPLLIDTLALRTANPWVVTAIQTGFTSALLFPVLFDLTGNEFDALVNVNPTTFTSTASFGNPLNGSFAISNGINSVIADFTTNAPFTSTFTSLTTWYIAGSTHQLGCNIIPRAYDLSGNLMDWIPINVDGSCNVTAVFGIAQSGTLNILGGGLSFPINGVTSFTVSNGQHNFNSSNIITATYDLFGNLVDEYENINLSTYLVTDNFGSSFTGRAVLIGPSNTTDTPFTSANPWTTQASSPLLFTTLLDTGGNLMDGLLNVNPSTDLVNVHFGTPLSGSLVITQ